MLRIEAAPSPPYLMDPASIGALIAGAVAVITTFVTGLWQWASGRRKLSIDAQASLVAGFVALLTSIQAERDRLLGRITALETENQKQDRRIARLELLIARNNIEIPDDDDEP